MKTDKIAQKLADILPDRPIVPGMSNPDTSKPCRTRSYAHQIKTRCEGIGSY